MLLFFFFFFFFFFVFFLIFGGIFCCFLTAVYLMVFSFCFSTNTPPLLPARNPSLANNSARNSPQVPRSLPPVRDSPAGSRKGSLADRPPLPPPTSSVPVKVPPRAQPLEPYFRMNSSGSKSSSTATPLSPWTPSSADWMVPPTFIEAMRQKSQSPISGAGLKRPDSYLSPTNVSTAQDSYLNPAFTEPVTSTPVQKFGAQRISIRDAYLTPTSFSEVDSQMKNATDHMADPISTKNMDNSQSVSTRQSLRRMRRLRSASCEDLSDYLRSVVYDPVSKSMNDLLEVGDNDVLPEPFPRLQTFSGSIEFCKGEAIENYYNIEGLHGKIYDGPGLTVYEIRKKFSKRHRSRLRRSVSNPNFIGSISKEQLYAVRLRSGYGSPKGHNKRSLTSLLPETLKKRLSKENTHHSSHGALSSAGISSHDSSRASSNRSSRHNSFSKRTTSKEDIVAKTSVKGINVTKRSRSFRRQKAHEENASEAKDGKLVEEPSSVILKDSNDTTVSVSNKELNAEVKLKAKVIGKPPNTAPKPAPKPSPRPFISSVPKSVPNSSQNLESNSINKESVKRESPMTVVETNDIATTRV